jgi:hypothetical protein
VLIVVAVRIQTVAFELKVRESENPHPFSVILDGFGHEFVDAHAVQRAGVGRPLLDAA